MGHSIEAFQGDWNVWYYYTAVDITGAAADICLIPFRDDVELLALGMQVQADCSTTTTDGVISLSTVTSAGVATEVASVAIVDPSLKGALMTEDSCNTIGSSTLSASNRYNAEPVFPAIDVSAGEYAKISIKTQGVGATQSVIPYVKYRYKPTTRRAE